MSNLFDKVMVVVYIVLLLVLFVALLTKSIGVICVAAIMLPIVHIICNLE
jgi:hypothetical protein